MRFQTIFPVLLAVIYVQHVAAETSLALVTTSTAAVIKRSSLKQIFMRYLNCNYEHEDSNRPFCVTLKSTIHIVEHKYYSSIFKVNFLIIQLFDHVRYDLMANDAENDWNPSSKLYSRVEMDLNHDIIREQQRNLPFLARKVAEQDQQAWVRDCTDVYSEIKRLIFRHTSDWVNLVYEWELLYSYYLDKYPGTGLDMYAVDVRDRQIFQEWSLQLYKSTRMFRNQKRDIRNLIPKYLKHPLDPSDPSYFYYNDTQSKMLWNTFVLLEKNLKEASNELFFNLYNSFGTVQYGAPVGGKQEYLMIVDNRFNQHSFYMTSLEKRYALLPKLRVIWIEIPSTSNIEYFILNASKWEKTKYIVLEVSTLVIDIVKVSIMDMMDMMDKGVERLRKQLNKNRSCDFLGLGFEALGDRDFQRGYYCKILKETLVMVTDVYQIFRKEKSSCVCRSK